MTIPSSSLDGAPAPVPLLCSDENEETKKVKRKKKRGKEILTEEE
jgi:hypothetical protein